MDTFIYQETIDRVRKMEKCFDKLITAEQEHPNAILEDPELKSSLCILMQYYENGQWIYDYELDEKGLLPQNLKRGVLSQDAVYDFYERIKNIIPFDTD